MSDNVVQEIIKLTNVNNTVFKVAASIIDNSSSYVYDSNPSITRDEVDKLHSRILELVNARLSDDKKIYDLIGQIYCKHYTNNELVKLLEFYKTELGRKMIDSSEQMFMDTAKVVNNWAKEKIQPEIYKCIDSFNEDQREDKN